MRYNVVALGARRYELRPGLFPNRPPAPRPGSLQARVLARLRVGPVDPERDAGRLFGASPARVMRSVNALRRRRDLNIRLAAPGAYEVLPGRYSERGYWGRQRARLTLDLLDLLRVAPEVDLARVAKSTGWPLPRLRSAMQSLRYRHPVASLGRNRFALRREVDDPAAEVAA